MELDVLFFERLHGGCALDEDKKDEDIRMMVEVEREMRKIQLRQQGPFPVPFPSPSNVPASSPDDTQELADASSPLLHHSPPNPCLSPARHANAAPSCPRSLHDACAQEVRWHRFQCLWCLWGRGAGRGMGSGLRTCAWAAEEDSKGCVQEMEDERAWNAEADWIRSQVYINLLSPYTPSALIWRRVDCFIVCLDLSASRVILLGLAFMRPISDSSTPLEKLKRRKKYRTNKTIATPPFRPVDVSRTPNAHSPTPSPMRLTRQPPAIYPTSPPLAARISPRSGHYDNYSPHASHPHLPHISLAISFSRFFVVGEATISSRMRTRCGAARAGGLHDDDIKKMITTTAHPHL
ncbi:hypothetical protein CVT25_008303 [Psilocybe cyanescens]|uniref:Uncharacterized protein n=1 Tax=Psilocybe cyanescens TaxID=93625 RepID=A0A409XJN4_PSICY|nr:hypothetical protein CVT25_008303 [Psilocybe cyanescens]